MPNNHIPVVFMKYQLFWENRNCYFHNVPHNPFIECIFLLLGIPQVRKGNLSQYFRKNIRKNRKLHIPYSTQAVNSEQGKSFSLPIEKYSFMYAVQLLH